MERKVQAQTEEFDNRSKLKVDWTSPNWIWLVLYSRYQAVLYSVTFCDCFMRVVWKWRTGHNWFELGQKTLTNIPSWKWTEPVETGSDLFLLIFLSRVESVHKILNTVLHSMTISCYVMRVAWTWRTGHDWFKLDLTGFTHLPILGWVCTEHNQTQYYIPWLFVIVSWELHGSEEPVTTGSNWVGLVWTGLWVAFGSD